MSSWENSWGKRLKIVLIIATIIPGVIDTIDYIIDPHHNELDNPVYIYYFPIFIALLFWPIGVGIAAAIVIAYLTKNKGIIYVLWVIYLIILYQAFPLIMKGDRWL